jgi:DNA-binding NtrC family response regulator
MEKYLMQSNILIIDDEENIRKSFEMLLSREGYLVSTASNFESALCKIDEGQFNVVFSDILLGDKTGIDVLREVRKMDRQPQFIFMTGYPSIDTALDAVRMGAFDYIPKPIKLDTLRRVIKNAVQHQKHIEKKEHYRQNLDAIFHSVSDAIVTLDEGMNIIEINEAAQRICGLCPTSKGGYLPDLLKECEKQCLLTVNKVICNKQPFTWFRNECQRSGRLNQTVTITAAPLLDSRKLFKGVVMVVRDDTRIAKLEKGIGERNRFHRMIGKTEKMQKLYRLIECLADVPTTALITGESGTGKELIADALHHEGIRKGKPFVKLNCAAISETLLESELFGHVKGAFTGALQNKVGRFKSADGGTIFLDEIGDISPAMQVRLLRVLQEKEFERVGDSSTIKVDVRVVAATNRDLKRSVLEGKFREDLYYRLKVVVLDLPPLRERTEDIPLLVEHFIEKFNNKFKKNFLGISNEVAEIFSGFSWPGNIRELEHVIENLCIVGRNPVIGSADLPPELTMNYIPDKSTKKGKILPEDLRSALDRAGWNKTKTARFLRVDRQTIYRKMQEFGILDTN